MVQPDEVAEAMRRGIELIHPYDQDESIPYTNYAPPGPQSYQQQVRYESFKNNIDFGKAYKTRNTSGMKRLWYQNQTYSSEAEGRVKNIFANTS